MWQMWNSKFELGNSHSVQYYYYTTIRRRGGEWLTIIPRAPMGSESIAHEAEGRMGYWLIGHQGERNNCFSKIQPVGQKYGDKTTLASN